jgi:endo-1,4-beta-xylanase
MTKPYKNQRAKKKSWAGHLRLIAGCGLIVCGLVALRLSFTSSSNALPVVHPTDLISGQDWSHFAGAKQIGNGIYIQALGRAIVNQDGSDNQANPPVNVRGPHLAFSNDIQIQYKTSQIPANGKASFYLYSSVPIIYDEWRYEPPQLRVDLSQNQVTAYQWNGRNDRPSSSKSWNLPVGAGAFVRLDLSKKKGVMSLSVNGTLLKGLKTQKIFNSGNIWFGADNSVGSSDWILKSLDAAPINGSYPGRRASGFCTRKCPDPACTIGLKLT